MIYDQFHLEGVGVPCRVAPIAAAVGVEAGGEPRVPQGARQRDYRCQEQRDGDVGGVQGVHGGAENPDF